MSKMSQCENRRQVILSLFKVIGASLPIVPSLIQMDSEIKQRELLERIDRLEDPISTLHEDVYSVSECIYKKIKERNRLTLEFEDGFYKRYSKPLFSLEKKGYIQGCHAAGRFFARGFQVKDPYYIASYLCVFFEDPGKYAELFEKMNNSKRGDIFYSDQTAQELCLPEPVICAVFKIYGQKGWGDFSQSNIRCTYFGKVLPND